MKIKQIAFQVPDVKKAKELLAFLFDADFKIDDSLIMDGRFNGEFANEVPLDLSFDYNMLKDADELELINSKGDAHWHSDFTPGFLSHLGIYCDSQFELDVAIKKLDEIGLVCIQDSFSHTHSRPNQDGSERSYRDVIYDAVHLIGFNIKLSLKV